MALLMTWRVFWRNSGLQNGVSYQNIMRTSWLFLVLFACYCCCCSSCVVHCPAHFKCSQHTDTYKKFMAGTLKADDIFQANTFSAGSLEERCKSYKGDIRKPFVRDLVRHNISCDIHCVNKDKNNGFNCLQRNNQDCLNVEHIVDKSNSDLVKRGNNVNIYGNLIMAYGKWNQAVGRKRCDVSEIEKKAIYGSFYDDARRNVIVCNGGSVAVIPWFWVVASIIMIVGGVALVILYLWRNSAQATSPERYHAEVVSFLDV